MEGEGRWLREREQSTGGDVSTEQLYIERRERGLCSCDTR